MTRILTAEKWHPGSSLRVGAHARQPDRLLAYAMRPELGCVANGDKPGVRA